MCGRRRRCNYGRVAEVMSTRDGGRLQEGRAGDRVRRRSEADATVRFSRSEPGSRRLGGSPCRAAGWRRWSPFRTQQKFDDAQETVPVEIVTDAQFNQIMKGEKTAKEVKPRQPRRQDRRAEVETQDRRRRSPRPRRDVPAPPPPMKRQPDRGSRGQAADSDTPPRQRRAASARAARSRRQPPVKPPPPAEGRAGRRRPAEPVKPPPRPSRRKSRRQAGSEAA